MTSRTSATGEAEPDDVAQLRREQSILRDRVNRLERELASARAVVVALKKAQFWDFTPYDVCPDPNWVAVDRDDVERLHAALAGVDHWEPWNTVLERRLAP